MRRIAKEAQSKTRKFGAVEELRFNRSAFRLWLEWCFCTGFRHGHELVMSLAIADNVYEADKTIEHAEARGWIVSTGCKPTREQLFFGVGGMSTFNAKTKEHWAFHRTTHGWAPNREKESEVREFLRGEALVKVERRKAG